MSLHLRNTRALVLVVILGSRARAQLPSDTLCIFSGPERSTLAWESAARSFSGGGVFGRIIVLRDARPVTSAVITLEPGSHRAFADSTGHFQITGAPNGRYLLRVRAIGFPIVADSITLGADGLSVLAVLAQPRGDIGITCPARAAPSRRPPNVR